MCGLARAGVFTLALMPTLLFLHKRRGFRTASSDLSKQAMANRGNPSARLKLRTSHDFAFSWLACLAPACSVCRVLCVSGRCRTVLDTQNRKRNLVQEAVIARNAVWRSFNEDSEFPRLMALPQNLLRL